MLSTGTLDMSGESQASNYRMHRRRSSGYGPPEEHNEFRRGEPLSMNPPSRTGSREPDIRSLNR